MMSVLILPHTWFLRKWQWLTFGLGKVIRNSKVKYSVFHRVSIPT